MRSVSVGNNRHHGYNTSPQKKCAIDIKPMAQQIIGGLRSYLDKEYTLVTFVLSILAVNSNLFAVILFILQ